MCVCVFMIVLGISLRVDFTVCVKVSVGGCSYFGDDRVSVKEFGVSVSEMVSPLVKLI